MVVARKLLSLFLALCLTLTLCPLPAFATENDSLFDDVDTTDWFYDAVCYVCEHSLMSGTDVRLFSPDETISRGTIVDLLYQQQQDISFESSTTYFQDVAHTYKFIDAISWAYECGIVFGYGNNTFGPDDDLVREQAIVILYRYATYRGYNTDNAGNLDSFADRADVSSYATEAVIWAVDSGVIRGFDSGVLKPTEPTTRAQLATMLARFYELVVEAEENTTQTDTNTNFSSSTSTSHTTNTANSDTLVDRETDSDNDGVPDYLESYFGTSSTSDDSDFDGLSDYVEIFVLGLDPTKADTNDDGILDGDEDTDADGLSNIEEIRLGTDPAKRDSDSDGLSDYDELYIYFSDPLVWDTDADGVDDGYEVELGSDPLIPNASFTITKEAHHENDSVTASTTITLLRDQVYTLSVEAVDNELFFPTDMPGYVGCAYNFSVEGDFESATISFEFDPSLIKDTHNLAIFYFNEETQTLEELDTTITDGVACASTTHFSTYILLNRSVYQSAFIWHDIWTSSESFSRVELVCVIDDSGSMASNDPTGERLVVAQNLIENLPTGSKVGVVRFSSSASVLTPTLTDDKKLAQSYVSSSYFKSSGGTKMYRAINTSFSLFSDDDDVLQMMVVLTDGESSDLSSHLSTVTTAQEKGIQIYTVGLGAVSLSYLSYLTLLAQDTGGSFFSAAYAYELAEIYATINTYVDLSTDTDNDGIPDYYEDNMVAFNGVKINLDKTRSDTDGDGLKDGEEVGVTIVYNEDGTKASVRGFLYSNPSQVDSDYDGIADNQDSAPLDNSFSGRLATEYATSDVSFTMDYSWFFKNNSSYNNKLATISVLFSSAIYADNSLFISDTLNTYTTSGNTIEQVMRYFGLEGVQTYALSDAYGEIVPYTDEHLSEIGIGYHSVDYNGETKTVLAVVVRGTNGTLEEWSSNFDIGDISTYSTSDDWENIDNHKGFDIAANRIMTMIESYITNNNLDTASLVYWVVGHSRGAAIANIMGANLESSGCSAFTYTFASPNTTLAQDASLYTSIFNIINEDDFVTYLPMAAWGYDRYGRTVSVSITNSYEKAWEDLTGTDYKANTTLVDKAVSAFEAILSGDARIECYRYTCDCHGDGSDNTITLSTILPIEVPTNAEPYCKITESANKFFENWYWYISVTNGEILSICQTPAYFMQILAAIMAKDLFYGALFKYGLNAITASRYDAAKSAIISANDVIKHPHYTESYYLLSQYITASQF